MPSRYVCQRVRRGGGREPEKNWQGGSLICQTRLHARRQTTPPHGLATRRPLLSTRSAPTPPAVRTRRQDRCTLASGGVQGRQAQHRSRRQMLSDQRWAGRGDDAAVVQGAASSSEVPAAGGTTTLRGRGVCVGTGRSRPKYFGAGRSPRRPLHPHPRRGGHHHGDGGAAASGSGMRAPRPRWRGDDAAQRQGM